MALTHIPTVLCASGACSPDQPHYSGFATSSRDNEVSALTRLTECQITVKRVY